MVKVLMRYVKRRNSYWLELAAKYSSTFLSAYVGIWMIVEPLNIDSPISVGNSCQLDWPIVHLGLSLISTSHIMLVLYVQRLKSRTSTLSDVKKTFRELSQNENAERLKDTLRQEFNVQNERIDKLLNSAARSREAQHHELIVQFEAIRACTYLLRRERFTNEEIVAFHQKFENITPYNYEFTPNDQRYVLMAMISVATADNNFRAPQQRAVMDVAKRVGVPEHEAGRMIREALEQLED